MSRTTLTRDRRTALKNPEMRADEIAEKAKQITDEDWGSVVEGLLLPIVVEDLFAAYVAEHGIDTQLTRMDRKFGIFRRKLLNSWKGWVYSTRYKGSFAVNQMLHDLLDESVTGYEKFRVTRDRVNNAQTEEIDCTG